MDIQTALRQWSGSTLDKAHRELGVEAADKIDELQKVINMAATMIDKEGYTPDVWFLLDLHRADIKEAE